MRNPSREMVRDFFVSQRQTNNLVKGDSRVYPIHKSVEEDIHLNPNSTKKEFSLRDPDGYYLTITEFHTYEG